MANKMTFKATAYNRYSIYKPQCVVVIATEIEADTLHEALNKIEQLANQWNKDSQTNQINIIECGGFVRNV